MIVCSHINVSHHLPLYLKINKYIFLKNILSKVNEECQKRFLIVSEQLVGNKEGENWRPLVLLIQEKIPTDTCPSNTHPKSRQCITFTHDPGAFQTAASVLGLRKSTSLVSSQSFGSPKCKPSWFSRTDIMRATLPLAGSPGWGSDPSLFRGRPLLL